MDITLGTTQSVDSCYWKENEEMEMCFKRGKLSFNIKFPFQTKKLASYSFGNRNALLLENCNPLQKCNAINKLLLWEICGNKIM